MYAELDAFLTDLVADVRAVLGETFVGAYVQGSFALGAGDLHSDCDVIVATTTLPSGPTEAGLRRLHAEIPDRPGSWSTELEASYADVESLRTVGGIGTRWLFNDHGHRTLAWDTHCNSAHTRWILHNHGITLAGPPAASLVDAPPSDALRDEARAALPTLLAETRTWAPFDNAWTQRYLVSTYCRLLYTLATAEVTSKRGALEWALEHLDPRWRPLLAQVKEDRALGWDPDARPRPGSLDAAYAFASYAESYGVRGTGHEQRQPAGRRRAVPRGAGRSAKNNEPWSSRSAV
ncbi:aminoglycoside adenylyltransferase domain-containing protein [Cryptosporangium sp. NPDC048952]|uniref:aminoglycoside adenylyltransferase domain-containing protein n=1 Tax=Cryptosporangium sp. NPDC048952 TaxID=3363961 RepID=UPI003722D62C